MRSHLIRRSLDAAQAARDKGQLVLAYQLAGLADALIEGRDDEAGRALLEATESTLGLVPLEAKD